MRPLPTREELRQQKLKESAELVRRRERDLQERRGLEEAVARYWELLAEFVVRAAELGIRPVTHCSDSRWAGASTRVEWVEGFRLTSGSVVTGPPFRYGLRERRLIAGGRNEEFYADEVSLFVLSTDAGLATHLSGPKSATRGDWPPVRRWDRMANILLALEAELEASLLALMDVV